MALLPKVGRKSPMIRLGIGVIYLLLILGGLTMLYPFLVTLTGAVSNSYDYERYSWYPHYWFHPEERYFKYLAEKYGDASRFDYFRSAYNTPSRWGSFRDVANEPRPLQYFPFYGSENNPEQWKKMQRINNDYERFVARIASTRTGRENLVPLFIRFLTPDYRDFIAARYKGLVLQDKQNNIKGKKLTELALQRMAQIRGERYETFSSVSLEMYINYALNLPKWFPQLSAQHIDFIDWLGTLNPGELLPVSRKYLWWSFLVRKNVSLSDYNKAAGLAGTTNALQSLTAVSYPVGDDIPDKLKILREEFLTTGWPLRLCIIKEPKQDDFVAALKDVYGTIDGMNTAGGTDYRSWDEVPVSAELPYCAEDTVFYKIDYDKLNMLRSAWRIYAEKLNASNKVERLFPESAYHDFLRQTYGSIDVINENYGWHYTSISQIELPIEQSDYVYYVKNRREFATKYITYNYKTVFGFLVTKGRAFFNTFVLVALTILATLTVNPLAAYALSRFRLKATNQILVFLLATMAFPPEVAMIPSFLLLRDFHLLNTYWALVLPYLANGFSIFLLKGFFDSLPKELYEAASIDGATEACMFRTITLPLSKPILAVIALNAFIQAYGGFMWAFLSCQNPKMWTIMVFLYQFQQNMKDHPSIVMAALVLASLPTLLVFMFCQKIILRGIIIPTMK